MASREYLLQPVVRHESPAKVFARLKSMVRGGFCSGAEVRKGTGPRGASTGDKFCLSPDFDGCETLALTISPNQSPQRNSQNEKYPRQHGRNPGPLPERRSAPPEPVHHSLMKICRTPAGTQPGADVSMDENAPFYYQDYPYSPMRKRLRQRQLLETGDNTRSHRRRIDEVRSEGLAHTLLRETFSVPSEDELETEPLTEPMIQPSAFNLKQCRVSLDRDLPMSPAKIFASMKQKENKPVNNNNISRRDLFNVGSSRLPRDAPQTIGCNIDENKVPESELSSKKESNPGRASRPLDTEPSDVPAPAAHVLLDDPLFLKSPQVSIPNKNPVVILQHIPNQPRKPQTDCKIYLRKWFLRKNSRGLFVDGINQVENVHWNSNIIMERISNFMLKTTTGRIYVLLGQMNLKINSGFPRWFLREFYNGFPSNWKTLYDKFTSKAKASPVRGRPTSRRGRSPATKAKQDASINTSVRRSRRSDSNTCESDGAASLPSARVSRSGRTIKPPLEYWKGGRVIVDAEMNVTIHTCYDTILQSPEVSTTVSARASEKPAQEAQHRNEGRKQQRSTRSGDRSVPLRKVKSPQRKRSRSRPASKAHFSPEPPVEPLSSSDEFSVRRSQRKQPAAKRTQHVDTVPRQTDRQRRDRRTRHKQAVTASQESATDATSPDHSSPEPSVRRRRERPQPQRVSAASSSNSEEEPVRTNSGTRKSRAAQKKQRTKSNKGAKKSPKETLPELPQSGPKPGRCKSRAAIPQMPDEDEWTEAELAQLQQAVSLYPKHVSGYWEKVARDVGTRSAAECYKQHTSDGVAHSPVKKAKKQRKRKEEVPKNPGEPLISARAGTLKRKQQVRDFLENMPRDDVEDAFSSAYMQNRRAEIPSMCPSEDADFTIQMLQPVTPTAAAFPEVKTPQCLHITPGMMGSPNGGYDEKYVYQLQKRMRKQQFNVRQPAVPTKKFSQTPSLKRSVKRCGTTEDDDFVVWEMFPDKETAQLDSEDEQDFYFSDND